MEKCRATSVAGNSSTAYPTWYASEFDGQDRFFGLVVGFEVELGYFSLSELESVRGPLGLSIERDKFFEPTSLRELQQQHRRDDLR